MLGGVSNVLFTNEIIIILIIILIIIKIIIITIAIDYCSILIVFIKK